MKRKNVFKMFGALMLLGCCNVTMATSVLNFTVLTAIGPATDGKTYQVEPWDLATHKDFLSGGAPRFQLHSVEVKRVDATTILDTVRNTNHTAPTFTSTTGFSEAATLNDSHSWKYMYLFNKTTLPELTPGDDYTITVGIWDGLNNNQWHGNEAAIWCDWDGDGVFDNSSEKIGEFDSDNKDVDSSVGGQNISFKSFTFKVPVNAVVATTRLRVLTGEADGGAVISDPYVPVGCPGEGHDYEIAIAARPLATNLVNGTEILSSAERVKSENLGHISLSWDAIDSESNYELQYDTDPLFSAPQTVGGITTTSYKLGENENLEQFTTYYIWVKGESGTLYSNIIEGNLEGYSTINEVEKYAIKEWEIKGGEDNSRFRLWNVKIDTVADPVESVFNVDTTDAAFRTFWTDVNSSIKYELEKTVEYSLGLTVKDRLNGNWSKAVAWIDWDGDGVFNATDERIAVWPKIGGPSVGTAVTVNFTVPEGAVLGDIKMRVRVVGDGVNVVTQIDASGFADITADIGECQDYSLTILDIKTPAIGLEVVQNGTEVSWTVEDETGVKEYQVVDVATGEVIEVVAAGNRSYSTTLPEGVVAKLVVVDNSGYTQTFVPADGNTVSVVYDLAEGWNLIAMPGDNADTMVLKKATVGGYWGWNGTAYEVIETPAAGQGFWVYSPKAVQTIVTAEKSGAEIALRAGWNLVGPTENINVPEAAHTVYGWNQKYDQILKEGIMVQGIGYWVFAINNEF